MSESPHILFGPYGTLLEEQERVTGIAGLSHPPNILNGPEYRHAIIGVAQAYLQAGATAATTNTFRARHELASPEGRERYPRIIAGHMDALRQAIEASRSDVSRDVLRIVSLGPARDCYRPDLAPTTAEAKDFHEIQAATSARVEAALAWFETVNTSREALGIALAAKSQNVSCVISFVLRMDGNLLSGEDPGEVIREIDAATDAYPKGYSFNCCPIEALPVAFKKCGDRASRVLAVYPNASSRPHDELDGKASSESVLTVCDPAGVARYLAFLAKKHSLKVVGGCCGFTPHHVAQIVGAVYSEDYQSVLPLTDMSGPGAS